MLGGLNPYLLRVEGSLIAKHNGSLLRKHVAESDCHGFAALRKLVVVGDGVAVDGLASPVGNSILVVKSAKVAGRELHLPDVVNDEAPLGNGKRRPLLEDLGAEERPP